MVIRPIHGDDELSLRLDLAILGFRGDRKQRDEEQKGDHLQRLEQHDAEWIERLLARVETELVKHRGAPAPVQRASQ